eukprot:scaffold77948_cov37-Prasinocladus_malaysianus.AAC.1
MDNNALYMLYGNKTLLKTSCIDLGCQHGRLHILTPSLPSQATAATAREQDSNIGGAPSTAPVACG